jgi:LuxR family maltose regulon positive regulatory protein
MAAKHPDARSIFYFPERLKKKLAQISSYPATVVEAPSGFGKTTAVREYLKENIPRGACERWHTCLGEPPSKAWEGICGLFAGVNRDAAETLRQLGPPTMDTLADVASVMREVRAPAETYLVVDNYQLFENEIPREAIDAFSVHACDNLHIIFIAQPLFAPKQSIHNANIHRLGKNDFFFDRGSTARMCRMFGIKLRDEELDYIHKAAEGWVAAIRLQAENYRETGSFASVSGMNSLIETAVWNKTLEQDRDFLMAVSLLDGFTPRQAAIMLNAPSLPKNIEDLLRRNAFISYSEERGVYYMHALLQGFLRKHFNDATSDFRFEMLRLAGDACSSAEDYFSAASFYRQAGDYPAIFSLPFTSRYLNSQKEAGIMKFIAQTLSECLDDMLAAYPFVMLAFAFQFLMSGMRAEFARLLGIIEKLVREPKDALLNDMERIKGEAALLESFTHFNDIERMSVFHRYALEYFGGFGGETERSTIVFGTTPWTFGITSVLCLFWSKRGELEKELHSMDECMPHYIKLSGGHGAGADSAMRAEAALFLGDDAESEILCYRAVYMAREHRQTSVCLCAELILARIAILRGDHEKYPAILDKITHYADEAHKQKPITRMTEMCIAAANIALRIPDGVPDWLRDADRIRETLYIQGQPYGQILYGGYLVQAKRWSEVFGVSDAVMDMAARMNYMLPGVYWNIYLAAACIGMKKGAAEARKYLVRALGLALPDRVYLPFAEYGYAILPVLERIREEKNFDAGRMDALIALCRRQIAGAEAVRKAKAGEKAVLTPRQREIAMRTRDGLSAKQIASELFVTEGTVKSAQKIIYDKLDIHSKIELTKMEF